MLVFGIPEIISSFPASHGLPIFTCRRSFQLRTNPFPPCRRGFQPRTNPFPPCRRSFQLRTIRKHPQAGKNPPVGEASSLARVPFLPCRRNEICLRYRADRCVGVGCNRATPSRLCLAAFALFAFAPRQGHRRAYRETYRQQSYGKDVATCISASP
jgi:hypothetical protein